MGENWDPNLKLHSSTAFPTQAATSTDASSSSPHSSPIDDFLSFPSQNPAPPPLPIEHLPHRPCRTELKILQDDTGPPVESKRVHHPVKWYTEH